jgi:hypothetical protein
MATFLLLASDIERLRELVRLLRKLQLRDLLFRFGYVKGLVAELLEILERIVRSFPSFKTGTFLVTVVDAGTADKSMSPDSDLRT